MFRKTVVDYYDELCSSTYQILYSNIDTKTQKMCRNKSKFKPYFCQKYHQKKKD